MVISIVFSTCFTNKNKDKNSEVLAPHHVIIAQSDLIIATGGIVTPSLGFHHLHLGCGWGCSREHGS